MKEQVQLFDVMPTILELSHKDGGSRPTTKNTHFAHSLVPQLKGAGGDPARIIYAEAGFLYPAELEPLHSGGPAMTNSSDPHSLEWPRRQEELEGCPQVCFATCFLRRTFIVEKRPLATTGSGQAAQGTLKSKAIVVLYRFGVESYTEDSQFQGLPREPARNHGPHADT